MSKPTNMFRKSLQVQKITTSEIRQIENTHAVKRIPQMLSLRAAVIGNHLYRPFKVVFAWSQVQTNNNTDGQNYPNSIAKTIRNLKRRLGI